MSELKSAAFYPSSDTILPLGNVEKMKDHQLARELKNDDLPDSCRQIYEREIERRK